MADPMSNHLLFSLLLCCLIYPFVSHGSSSSSSYSSPVSISSSSVSVGVILDLSNLMGKKRLTSIKMAISDYYTEHRNSSTRIVLDVRDSKGDIVTIFSSGTELLQSTKVNAILGPQTADGSQYLAAICTKHKTPVISFSATSPLASPLETPYPYFLRSSVGPAAQSEPIAGFISSNGWKSTVLIHSSTSPLIPHLTDILTNHDIHVARIIAVHPSDSDHQILTHIRQLKCLTTRVFIVHVSSRVASRLFSNAKLAGMMEEGYAWILTSELSSVIGSDLDPDLFQGAIVIRPWIPRTKRLKQFQKRFKRSFHKEHGEEFDEIEAGDHDYYAYDSAYALAIAVENAAGANNTDLLEPILETGFDGISGRFKLIDGELTASAFEFVNVIGEKGRPIGKWTVDDGFKRTAAIVWPGESTDVPKGWDKKLRIGVPGKVEPGFSSFLWIERDNVTGRVKPSGFVIEVFEAALAELDYKLDFEYEAFVDAEGRTAGNYNDLVRQVYLKKYDAVVADVTITANRTLYADFTQPYTVSGVAMVVPLKNKESLNTWIFLKPLTTDLWVVSGAFFVFTGAVVWILEHRINADFRGPPANQFGTVFYFTFSTLVFAHTENVMSNLSRFVVIVWVFVVLILTSSYTASLTSMLTVQQFQPAVGDINDLIKNGEYVGYLADSFVKGLLLSLGFDESKLRPYRSPQQYVEALSKGSGNGGVSAIVDEIPYLRVFLKDYCGNYTMAGPTYKTGGFGYVFPKGSSVVSDITTAILKVTEGYRMREIEYRWFGDEATCSNGSSSVSYDSLGISSFWGLFLITGSASAMSLLLFIVSFFYEHRDVFSRSTASEGSIWRRLATIVNNFDHRDHSSHTFRRTGSKDGSMACSRGNATSAYSNELEVPTSISSCTHEEGTTCPAKPPQFVSGRFD